MTAEAHPIAKPVAEHRWDAASWAVLLLGVALVISSIAQMGYRLSLPTDGWSWTVGAVDSETLDTITYDANLIGQPSPIQPGDVVLAVAGIPYNEALLVGAAALGPSPIPNWQAGRTVQYLVQRDGVPTTLAVPLYHWQAWDILRLAVGNTNLLLSLVITAIGLFVFAQRPFDLAARVLFLLSAVGLTTDISNIVYWGLPEIANPPAFLLAILFTNWIFGALLAPTVLLLALTFPQPKPLVLRHRVLVIPAIYSVLPLLVLLFGPQAFLGWSWTATCGLLSLLSVVHTLFTARDRVSRAQLRWAGLGFGCLAFNLLLSAASGFAFFQPFLPQLLALLGPFLQLAFPLTLAVAILRYRLFDIDIILNRALVYGALTLCVIGGYIGIVTYFGTLVQSENNLVASLVATGVVAVLFQPLRMQLQRGVNRLLFGQRNEPYAVMTTLGQQLDIAAAPNAVFSAIVETIGQTLKLPYVAITSADEGHVDAVFGQLPAQATPASLLRLPLGYQHHAVGVLIVAPRVGQARFADVDRELLHNLARQTGIAVYAARITADVQRSRERIVHAREEERRRLRRDLHDGLGPHLASQTLTLDVIAKLVRSDAEQATALLQTVREQMQQAVGDIRDLIYGLRPPVLDDLGLPGAIEELAQRVEQHGAPPIALHLPAQPVPLPAAVEVAAYRITQEALNNVVRHARASACDVRLSMIASPTAAHETLILEISDNGIGIAPDRLSGIGLQSMRERSAELGGELTVEPGTNGGTRVRAALPVVREADQ